MSSKYKILLVIAPAVFFLDIVTKGLVLKTISIGEVLSVIPGFFDLVHVRNTGAAFGMLASWGEGLRVPFFYGISVLAIVILFFCFRSLHPADRFYSMTLSLIAGGVLGNLLDRVRFGSVIYFISLHVGDKSISGVELRWPAFNVADSAITVSVILLLAYSLKRK